MSSGTPCRGVGYPTEARPATDKNVEVPTRAVPRPPGDRRPFPRRLAPALVLLAAAVTTGVFSYAAFDAATTVPVADFSGSVTGYVSAPAVDVSVDAGFYQDVVVDNGRLSYRTVGPDSLTHVIMTVHLRTKAMPERISCLLMLSDDARLAEVLPVHDSAASPQVRRVDQGYIENHPSSGSTPDYVLALDRQIIRFDLGVGRGDFDGQVVFVGTLGRDLTHRGAGLRYIEAPDLLTEPATVRTTFGAGFDIDGDWYGGRNMRATALVGTTGSRELVDSADPPFSPPDRPAQAGQLVWTGRELVHPRAVLSDRSQQQSANRVSFIAGALGGVSGGLLIEAFIRMRPFSEPGDSDRRSGTRRAGRIAAAPDRPRPRWPAARVIPGTRVRRRRGSGGS